MKIKSPRKNKGNSMNESSSACVEPSFSKITFRKRDHCSSLEMLSDIDEKKDVVLSKIHLKSKKKRKKKKTVSTKDCTDGTGNEEEAFIGLEAESPELNHSSNDDNRNVCDIKNKKKKVSLSPSHKPHLSSSTEIFTDKNEYKEPVVELGMGYEANERNYSVSDSGGRNFFKKKKKKQFCEDPFYESNANEKEINDLTKDKSDVSLSSEFPIKKISKKHKLQLDGGPEEELRSHRDKNDFPLPKENPSVNKQKVNNIETETNIHLNINHDKVSEVETYSKSPSKKHKRKNVIEIENLYSPLPKKEKDTHQSKDEINLNVSSSEHFSGDIKDTENQEDEIHDYQNPSQFQSVNSAKKLKRKCKHLNRKFNLEHESPLNSNDGNEGRSLDIECYPKISINKPRSTSTSDMLLADSKPSPLVCISDSGMIDNNNQPKKKHKKNKSQVENSLITNNLELFDRENQTVENDNRESEEIENMYLKSSAPSSKLIKCGKSKKNKQLKKDNLLEENSTTKCVKSAEPPSSENPVTVTGLSESNHTNRKSNHRKKLKDTKQNILSTKKKTKSKDNIELLRDQLLKEALSNKEESEVLFPKSSKLKKTGIEGDLKTNRKDILKENIGIKEAESLPPISTKLKKKFEGNVDTLRKHLLKEAISNSKNAGDLPPKLKKAKTGKKEDVDTLRKRLLKEAISQTNEDQEFSPKPNKLPKVKVKENINTLKKRLLIKALSGTTKEAKDFFTKSTIMKTGVEESVETLRKRLLHEAIRGTNKDEELPSKSTNKNKGSIKAHLLSRIKKNKQDSQKDLKNKSKNNHKKKHKKNDIDMLTNVLISKALKKVSSSSTSHSSQENINLLNLNAKNITMKGKGETKAKT